MPNDYFKFKQFVIFQIRCSMKVTTDSCLFGAWVAEEIKSQGSYRFGLDIGSGTGLLSMMVAQKNILEIEALEIQKEDYSQSLENIAQSDFKERIKVINADATHHNYSKNYDVVFSNPPFYEGDLKGHKKSKNIAHHDEGLKLQPLLSIIKNNLSNWGSFYLLLPSKREDELNEILPSYNFYINKIVHVYQTENHPSFRIMVKGSFEQTETVFQKITIKKNNEYSTQFVELLKEYYLNL